MGYRCDFSNTSPLDIAVDDETAITIDMFGDEASVRGLFITSSNAGYSGVAGNAILVQTHEIEDFVIDSSGKTVIGYGVLDIGDAVEVPTDTPDGGGSLYVESGALKYRGSSGTVTTLAPA